MAAIKQSTKRKPTATSSSSEVRQSKSSLIPNQLARITKLETALLAEEYDPNPLLALLSLARNESAQVVHKSIWALHRVFINYITDGRVGGLAGDLNKADSKFQKDDEDALASIGAGGEAREVKVWVRERLLEYVEILAGLMSDAEPALRTSAVPLLFSLLPPLSASISSSTDRPVIHTAYFRLMLKYLLFPSPSLRGARPLPTGGWKTLEAHQVDEEGVLPSDVIKIVTDDFWAKYDDIRWAFFKEASYVIQNHPGPLAHPDILLSQLLPLTNLPKLAEDINAFFIPSLEATPTSSGKKAKVSKGKKGKGKSKNGKEIDALPDWMAEYESSASEDDDEPIEDGKKRARVRTSHLSMHAAVHSVLSHVTVYTTLWETVLASVPLDEMWTRKILVGLHGEQGIMGHFKPERRLRIADWLGALVDGGGAMAMLAMNGLFVLMTQYNFEYPRFYDRLYGLLDRNIMHVRYRARFFRLLDTFLSGSLLPAAMIASFIKRLSRLALSAPPSGTILLIPFIYNLFKRHPGCMSMLQRASVPATTTALLALSSSSPFTSLTNDSETDKKAAEEQYASVDPYDPLEVSPLKANALSSSCWELAALQNHYLAPISTLAKIFGEPFTKAEYNLEDFLDHGYGTLFETEANRKIKNAPALSVALETTADGDVALFPSFEVERDSSASANDLVVDLWAF